MKILGTGLTGLIGSRIIELLNSRYDFENLSRSSGVDIADRKQVLAKINSSDATIVLHLAAKTDVDGCERDRKLGKNGDAWRINVKGTENVADACLKTNKKLIFISTDFVFDGKNPPDGGYSEEDIPNPVNWYAKTKYEAEKIVSDLLSPWIIVRLAYPYRANFAKLDFCRVIIERLRKKNKIFGITDHLFCPTFVDDIAFGINCLINRKVTGIFHMVGAQALSPYDAEMIISDLFDLDRSLISKTTREQFFKGRAPRPFELPLKNAKIEKLGIKMKTLEEGLRKIKDQMSNVKY